MKAAYWALAFLLLYFALAPVAGVGLYGFLPFGSWEKTALMLGRSLPYLGRSLFIASLVTACSTAIGLASALAIKRFDFFGRRALRLASVLPLVSPPFVGSLAFIMLFGKRGLVTSGLLGLSVSPFGWQGIALLEIIGFSALAQLVVSGSIDRIDTDAEDAARTLGASELAIFRGITLRSMLPEISAAAVLVFLGSMADFSTPLIIGGAYRTLAADLYIQITGLYDMRSAAVSGLLLLAPCAALFVYQRARVGQSRFYSAGSAIRDIRYRFYDRRVKAACVGALGVYGAFVALQFGFILVGAFTRRWGYDYTPTLEHFIPMLRGSLSPFANSLALSFVSALFASLLGVLLGYMIKRRPYAFRGAVDFAATLPAAVPGILFGIGYLVVFKYPILGIGKWWLPDLTPPILLGTGAIVYLICVFRYLNVGLRSGYAALDHIDPELENAARNLGRSDHLIFAEIVLPLLTPAFYGAFLKNFSAAMTTLGAIIFLILPSNKVAVQQLFQIITGSGVGAAAAMGVTLSSVTLLLLAVFRGGARLASRCSG